MNTGTEMRDDDATFIRADNRSTDEAKSEMTTKTFAETLRALMLKNKMSASDLAREVFGTIKNNKGYKVARNRDRIGHYLAGTSFPEKENLIKIAKALNVAPEVLTKAQPAPPVRESRHPNDIQVTFHADAVSASLAIAKITLTTGTVVSIMELIGKDAIRRQSISPTPHHTAVAAAAFTTLDSAHNDLSTAPRGRRRK